MIARGEAEISGRKGEKREPPPGAFGPALRPPGFVSHLFILWRMRLWSSANARRGGRLPVALAHLPALLPGLVLAAAAHALMVHPAVAGDPVVSRFFLGLICFVAALVWVAWPILSAGVDDHSELSRYFAFPISRLRLLFASTLGGLIEPIAFIVYAPVVGAAIAYAGARGLEQPLLAAALFVAFVSMCAAWSRAGLHFVLRVLRSNHGARALGVFLALVIAAGLLLPPVDTSWLYEEGAGFAAIDADVLASAAVAFGRVPPGYLAEGLRHLSEGNSALALLELLGLVFYAALGMVLANELLGRAARAGGSSKVRRGGGQGPGAFGRGRGRLGALVLREAVDLFRNPRARLLVGVPFVLAVLLRLLSGRDLFAHFLGPVADAWLMGAMALYGAVLILSTFAQNAFAYDGHGLRLLLASPVPPSLVLWSKNIVHGLAAAGLGLLVCLFYLVYLGGGDLYALLVSMAAVLALVPVGLTAGNLLSIRFPVKFHASLQRRDRAPLPSAVLGLLALGLGALALPVALHVAAGHGPGGASVAVALLFVALGWALYAAAIPLCRARLLERREAVLGAITRS